MKSRIRESVIPIRDRPEPGAACARPASRDTHDSTKLRRNAPEKDAAPQPTEMRVVGQLESNGRHFLIVEKCTPGEAPAPPPLQEALGIPQILTRRELQIAGLVSIGRLNKQIAALLKISEYTVSTHIRRIYSKLSINRRSLLAAMYAKTAAVVEPAPAKKTGAP
jgi:DNA-binding CsgD family transcriptional regulator